MAHVSILNPSTGSISNKLAFTITVTRITPTFGMSSRDANGNYFQSVTLANTGYATASNLKVTLGQLGNAVTSTALPINLGPLAPGQSLGVTLEFPPSAGTPGSTVSLHVSGTYTGGTWSKASTVTLP